MPETPGVHWNTVSGDVELLAAQAAASMLLPLVVPVTLPPSDGMTLALRHSGGSVVVVVVVTVVVVGTGIVVVLVVVGSAKQVAVATRMGEGVEYERQPVAV